ncbi:MAG: hypothetical protein IBX61_09305 [Thermoleophilia bacterium]|nr:hypothetical protein [Thermoleophilia bacterium]
MPLPSAVTPIKAFAQVKFPTAFLFWDKKGEIAEYLADIYDESIQIGDFISATSANEASIIRVEEEKLWISQKQQSKDDEFITSSFVDWSVRQFERISKILNASVYTAVGLRIYYFEEFSAVNDAVQSFKDTFIDYSQSPYKVVSGTPTKCIIEFGVKEEAVNKNFRLTPIHDERVDSSDEAGGILYDLDTFHNELTEAEKLNKIFEDLHMVSDNMVTSFIDELRGYSENEKVVEA